MSIIYITRTQNPKLQRELFRPVKNKWVKPKEGTGLWACEYTPDAEFVSAWDEFMFHETEERTFDPGVCFTLKSSVKVFVIDSKEDFQELLDQYEWKQTPYVQKCMEWANIYLSFALEAEHFGLTEEAEDKLQCAIDSEELAKNPPYKEKQIDFERLAEDFDALFVTKRGICENRWHLNSWDIASLLVLNFDAIDKQWPLED